MRSNFALWNELYGLNPNNLTTSTIEKINDSTNEVRSKYITLLHFLYASGVALEEKKDVEAKATLIKSGEASLIAFNPIKVREEIESILEKLGERELKEEGYWGKEGYRVASLLMQLPFETTTMEQILDAATLLSRSNQIPAECAYTLLFYIYEQTKNPLSKRFFSSVEQDFWENYVAIMLKTMGRFLKDAAMEYVVYYELPPGSSNENHLIRCEQKCAIAIECCFLVHKASILEETEIDKKIYQFCTEAILNQDPKPLVTYSYRLLDLSSEDFFITLPKDLINKYIVNAIKNLQL